MSNIYMQNAFDIFPLVFPAHSEVSFTVQSLGTRKQLHGAYTLSLHRANAGASTEKFSAWNTTEIPCHTDENGMLHFLYTAETEGEYFVRIYQENCLVAQLYVYALEKDLACRYPLRGDFHVHTTGSDGQETPPIVCANYRRKGYDFIVITDHDRYYPSLEAIQFYQNVKIPLQILPGEEVHLPDTTVHIVNAGGLFSVNGLLPIKENYLDTNGELSKRRFDDSVQPPNVYTMDAFNREIDEIEQGLKTSNPPIPNTVDSRSYAVCLWIFDKVRKADGLGIFAHPNWINDLYQIPEDFTRYMLENHPFDAFEVLGGENYYQQNGLQTAMYYDEYRYGRVHPIVGSTDSHSSLPSNRNWDICSTIVFAKSNARKDILSAVKEKYSLAVDTLSKEYRLVGEYRLQKYGAFLMERYFPIHDKAAAMDGEMLYQYANGNANKAEVELLTARFEKMMKKYIYLE